MRYFRDIEKDDEPVIQPSFKVLTNCSHPAYSTCTLFKIGDKGLCVIQQIYLSESKLTMWSSIPETLSNELYLHEGFQDYFYKHAGVKKDGLYPTVTLRQMMWALRMKPIKKQPWETVFDRKFV